MADDVVPHPQAPSLNFADLAAPGITRRRRGGRGKLGWLYFAPGGGRITEPEEIARLNRIALPPAYADAWFCPDPAGHIQAIGLDARGRRQYRYHTDFRAGQESAKFDRCAEFGAALPKLRARVERDIALPGLSHDRVVAAVVRLLDLGHLRVGNREYAEANESYGATTLTNDHARVRGEKVRLTFRGKHGREHDRSIRDRALAAVVRRCQDLPGQCLFTWKKPDGAACPVGSADVNAYIQDVMGEGFSAKHFRTWWASVIGLERAAAGLPLKEAVQAVADELGNTPAVARASYIHPQVMALLQRPADERPPLAKHRPTRWMSAAERGFRDLLDGAAADDGPGRTAAAA